MNDDLARGIYMQAQSRLENDRNQLRDLFAASTLTGLLAHRGVVSPTHPLGEVDFLSTDAYAIADAMLAERDKNA